MKRGTHFALRSRIRYTHLAVPETSSPVAAEAQPSSTPFRPLSAKTRAGASVVAAGALLRCAAATDAFAIVVGDPGITNAVVVVVNDNACPSNAIITHIMWRSCRPPQRRRSNML